MKRCLVTKENLRTLLDPDAKCFVAEKGTILTPGAMDYLREKQVRIVYGGEVAEQKKEECTNLKEENLALRIEEILKKEFSVNDPSLAVKIASILRNK
jgi:ethanolamine utilization cobalamin adenosyltransferase